MTCDLTHRRSLNNFERDVLTSYREKAKNCMACERFCGENKLEKKGPLSFFNIGVDFGKDEYSIVFVGKNHWYQTEDIQELKQKNHVYPGPGTVFYDCREEGRELFKSDKRAFWKFIREITRSLYPKMADDLDRLLDNIVITNLTKCNTSPDSNDTTPFDLTEKCIELLNEEIKRLNPKHVVFFTGKLYDEYIDSLDFGYSEPARDLNTTDTNFKKKIGKLNVYWWEREFSQVKSGKKLFFLRTRHPQRAPGQLVEQIINWVRNVP
jgi:hypothetical protein